MNVLVTFVSMILLTQPVFAGKTMLLVTINRRSVPPAAIERAKQDLLKMGCPAVIRRYIPYDSAPFYGVVQLLMEEECSGPGVFKIKHDGRYSVSADGRIGVNATETHYQMY